MIPKLLHAIWTGGPLPEQHERWLDGWQQLHPTWTLNLWDDAALANYPLQNQAVYDDAEKVAPGSVGQLRSDVARYEILREFGGVYIDTDTECLRPIDELCRVSAFAAWETPGRWLNNAVMGCEPGHPFLAALVDGLGTNVRRYLDPLRVRPNVLTGPQYLTPIYRTMPDRVTVYPKDFFYPYLYHELHRGREQFPHSYCVHHWFNTRNRKGVPL